MDFIIIIIIIIPWPIRTQINEMTTADDDNDSEPTLTPAAVEALRALRRGKTTDDKKALVAELDQWPSCFYAENSFDPDDSEQGLFRSQFLLRVLRHIWTAPGSAMDGCSKIPRVCHAVAHGQLTVTPQMIAYACVQARTMISTSDWADKDGSYKYEKMFDNVILLFESDPTDKWAVETLAWCQRGVFGSGEQEDDDDSDDEPVESPGTILRARRAARRRAQAPPDSSSD
ncbi:hypothetical protein R3P38DRAFT_3575790 [Favolaschia claudopus]|uniref:Uncharacterized protein n=1 Tax=Favolaschia claudopus TaxID=2862362 RepID=A0AAW0ALI2_9AGAR